MKPQILGGALLGVALLAGQARAAIITINFEDLTPGCNPPGSTATCASPAGTNVIIVSNQYLLSDGVTFSATNPFVVLVESGTGYQTTTQPNLITTGNSSGTVIGSPLINLTITFANPAFNLKFDAFGNDTTPAGQTFAQADIFQNNSSTATTINLTATNGASFSGTHADPQDLSAFPAITKLVIKNDTDAMGSSYDNIIFSTADSPTPEPSTLLLTGLCGIVWAGRRFLARKG
jgi:hypothetical protein